MYPMWHHLHHAPPYHHSFSSPCVHTALCCARAGALCLHTGLGLGGQGGFNPGSSMPSPSVYYLGVCVPQSMHQRCHGAWQLCNPILTLRHAHLFTSSVQLFWDADGKPKQLGLVSVLRDVAAGLEYLHSKKVRCTFLPRHTRLCIPSKSTCQIPCLWLVR
jgi:hypothetical protein